MAQQRRISKEKEWSRGEREAKKRDGFPEREASTVLGGIVVTVLYSSSVYSRETDEHVRQEEGWCLMHVIVSRNMTAPHYFLFQSPSAYCNTLSARLQAWLFYFPTLHFIWVLIIWIIEQKKRSYKKWARDEIETRLSEFAKDELHSAATQNNWADGRTAGKLAKWNSIQFPELWPAVEMQIPGIKSWWIKGGHFGGWRQEKKPRLD